MLVVKEVSKKFGEFCALDGVSFTIEPGTIWGYLGPNGAGKTTTMRILTLASKPSSGDVWFNGKSIFSDSMSYKREFGYVADNPFLYPLLTGREFLNFIADMRGISLNDRSAIDRYLDLFEMTKDAEKLISGYSHGMKKKIGIIESLLHSPKLLFLDEPTSGIDALSVKKFRDLLASLKNDGVAILLTTHILEIAEKLCDRICIINKGKIVSEGTFAEISAFAANRAKDLEDIFIELTEPTVK